MKVTLSILVLAIVGIGGWYLIERLNTPSPIEIHELTNNLTALDSIRGSDSLRYDLIQDYVSDLDSLRADTNTIQLNESLETMVDYLKNLKNE